MRYRLLVILLIVALFSSVVYVAFAATCLRCNGTGKIKESTPCPTCGGSTTSVAGVVLKRTFAGSASSGPHLACSVSGVFNNGGVESVYGTVTATVKKSQTETLSNTSARTLFPPSQDITVMVMVEGVDYQPYYAYSVKLNADCPTCGGVGYVFETVTCPDCGGTGVVSDFAAITNVGGIGGAIVGVVVVGAVVATGFVFFKKRRVTEASLHRLTSFEFQEWVVKKMRANAASQKDVYLGIDAYTQEGYPIQIRNEDDVGKRMIDSFAAALARNKARNGTVVAFSFGKDAFEGVMKARINYRLEIKTMTAKELLNAGSRLS